MKISKLFFLAGLTSYLAVSSCFAGDFSKDERCSTHGVKQLHIAKKHGWHDPYQLANAGFSTMDPSNWYQIQTPVYPATVPLSLHRNRGFTKGDIHLKHNGIKVDKSGNYWVTITAVLLNTNEEYTPLVPIFLVKNGVFDPTSTNTIGGVGALPPNVVTSIQVSGILKNLKSGTKLSIVATNGGSPEPEPVTVIGWDISLFRIPCECKKHCHHHHHHHHHHD